MIKAIIILSVITHTCLSADVKIYNELWKVHETHISDGPGTLSEKEVNRIKTMYVVFSKDTILIPHLDSLRKSKSELYIRIKNVKYKSRKILKSQIKSEYGILPEDLNLDNSDLECISILDSNGSEIASILKCKKRLWIMLGDSSVMLSLQK